MKTTIICLSLLIFTFNPSFAVEVNPDINFKVNEEELVSIMKEIDSAGQSVTKFMVLLKSHATLSKSSFIQSVKSMQPVVRTAIDKNCVKEEKGELIYRSICYRDSLDVMENDINLILDSHFSDGAKLIDIREELIAKNHFAGKILYTSCGKKASETCLENKLAYLQEELIIAYNKMSESVDELARWSIESYSCNNLGAAKNCKTLKKWTITDFVSDAKKIEYVPFNRNVYSTSAKPKIESRQGPKEASKEAVKEKKIEEKKEERQEESKVEENKEKNKEESKKERTEERKEGQDGENAGVETFDCSPEAKKLYRQKSRELQTLENFGQILLAQQQSYACKVKEYHSTNHSAELLSELGLKMARIAQDMIVMTPESCSAHIKELKDLASSMKSLQSSESSQSLQALTDEFEHMNDSDCSVITTMIGGQSSNIPIRDNLCAWMGEMEQKSRGSTVGFSPILAPCK